MDDKFPPLDLSLRPETWAYRMPQAFLGLTPTFWAMPTPLAPLSDVWNHRGLIPFWTASQPRDSRAVDTADRSTNQPNRVEFSDISDPIPAARLGKNRTIEQQFVSKQRPRGLAEAAWR